MRCNRRGITLTAVPAAIGVLAAACSSGAGASSTSSPPATHPAAPAGPKAKTYFEDYQSKVNARTIPGLGDAAYYDGYASISVLKGDAYVRIAVGIASNLSAEKTLAAAALARM